MSRALRALTFLFLAPLLLLPVGVAAQTSPDDPSAAADNPFFEVEDIEESFLDSLPFELHGRFDLTHGRFEDERNVDGSEEEFLQSVNPALSLTFDVTERLRLLAELELDGVEGELELDQMLLRIDTPPVGGNIDLGIGYVPFGIERRYYSSATNPLIDRPSPFRRVYPGSYSDLGVFVRGGHEFGSGRAFEVELSVTRGLRGPGRADRPDDLLDSNDEPQLAGRIGVTPVPGLEIGASGLLVWVDEEEQHRKLDLLGLDVTWRGDFHHVRFEIIGGGFERSPADGGDLRRGGWYIEGYRRFPFDRPWLEAIEAVVRFDSLDENSRVRDFRDVDRWAFGLNWVPRDGTRLKTEVILSDEHYDEISNDGFLVQWEFHF